MSGGPSSATISDRELLVHQALLYRSDEELVAAALPFLREGLAADDAVVVITTQRKLAVLADALDDDVDAVEMLDSATWFTTPARTLTAYHERARRAWWPRGRLRLLAEPLWTGLTPLEVVEWKRHESLLNVAFAGTPSRLLCSYDCRSSPIDVVADTGYTHRAAVVDDGIRASLAYTDPAEFYAECNRAPLPPPVGAVEHREFSRGGLDDLRGFVTEVAARYGLDVEQSRVLVLVVNEVATNVIKHGSGAGAVWLWTDGHELLCDVIDPHGTLEDNYLGYFPPESAHGAGAGLWAVRQMCHLVEIRSGPAGSVVRMHVRPSADLMPRDGD